MWDTSEESAARACMHQVLHGCGASFARGRASKRDARIIWRANYATPWQCKRMCRMSCARVWVCAFRNLVWRGHRSLTTEVTSNIYLIYLISIRVIVMNNKSRKNSSVRFASRRMRQDTLSYPLHV
jgi:hypothetical protein